VLGDHVVVEYLAGLFGADFVGLFSLDNKFAGLEEMWEFWDRGEGGGNIQINQSNGFPCSAAIKLPPSGNTKLAQYTNFLTLPHPSFPFPLSKYFIYSPNASLPGTRPYE
jgi:hypothetical protein